MYRREFLKDVVVSSALLACFPAELSGIQRQQRGGLLEKRSLGKTGETLSVLGFGGIVVTNATPEQASRRVAEAIERGVNYFDVAPSYGNAEDRLGPALEPYRQDVFLACKTLQRTRQEATAELDASLQKMRTDHFDLYQLHAMTRQEDVETALGPGGALEAFHEARRKGKIRFIGFSAHSVEAAQSLMSQFDFDTILFPVNYATWHSGNFGPQVLETASQKGMGILALKALAKGPWATRRSEAFPKCWYEPLSDPDEARQGLRFTLSHPVTAAIPPGDENLFRLALDLAQDFEPLRPEEAELLKSQAQRQKPLFEYRPPSG